MLKLGAFIKLIVLGVAASVCQAADTDVARQGHLNDNYQATFQTKCGHIRVVALRIEDCARTLTEILEGGRSQWPNNADDIIPLCGEFEKAEKCIREVGRECLTGLKRTISSTFASAIGRTRKKECTPAKRLSTLKAVKCVEQNEKLAHNIMGNASDHLRIITDQMDDFHRKAISVCCMLDEVENSIKRDLGPRCPDDVGVVVRLYRTTLEDVINVVCRAPKCVDIFKGYSVRRSKQSGGVISLLIESLFSLT